MRFIVGPVRSSALDGPVPFLFFVRVTEVAEILACTSVKGNEFIERQAKYYGSNDSFAVHFRKCERILFLPQTIYFPTTGIELSIADIPNAITATTTNAHAIESTGFPTVSELNPIRSREVMMSGCTK